MSISRRVFMLTTMSLFMPPVASASTKMTVYKDPGCGCCGSWVDHVRATGFAADVIEEPAMNRIKAQLGVPRSLASCHTARIKDYVIEGHVPAAEITRLLSQAPKAIGLAVPGMPIGSPGMEVDGAQPDTYDVILFSADGAQSVFARYRGHNRLDG
jgi:hypothetical protein